MQSEQDLLVLPFPHVHLCICTSRSCFFFTGVQPKNSSDGSGGEGRRQAGPKAGSSISSSSCGGGPLLLLLTGGGCSFLDVAPPQIRSRRHGKRDSYEVCTATCALCTYAHTYLRFCVAGSLSPRAGVLHCPSPPRAGVLHYCCCVIFFRASYHSNLFCPATPSTTTPHKAYSADVVNLSVCLSTYPRVSCRECKVLKMVGFSGDGYRSRQGRPPSTHRSTFAAPAFFLFFFSCISVLSVP